MTESGEAGEADEAPPLTDPEALLFRQVHPTFFDGEPTSQAFRPNSGDAGKMSVDRESMTTAKAAFDWYTQTNESVGTWGLTLGELNDEAQLAVIPEPVPGNEAHAFVDFRGVSPSACKSKSKLLRRKAVDRGCLYEPSAN